MVSIIIKFTIKHETTAFGYRISDESAVRSISADALKAEDDAIAYRYLSIRKMIILEDAC